MLAGLDELLKVNAFLLAVFGLAGMGVSIYIWRYLIPTTSIQKLREELDYRLAEIGRKDEELAKFREQRELDLRRLVDAEADLRRFEQALRDLRSWRYGAQEYIRALEECCRAGGRPLPDRRDYGIDSEARSHD